MADIIKELSVVFVYNSDTNLITTTDVKEIRKIISKIYNHTENIIITMFPDLINIICPEEQIGVTITKERMVIANKKLGSLVDKKVPEFSKFCYDVIKCFDITPIESWGTNQNIQTDILPEKTTEFISEKILNKLKINITTIEPTPIIIRFKENGNNFIFTLNPVFDLKTRNALFTEIYLNKEYQRTELSKFNDTQFKEEFESNVAKINAYTTLIK